MPNACAKQPHRPTAILPKKRFDVASLLDSSPHSLLLGLSVFTDTLGLR